MAISLRTDRCLQVTKRYLVTGGTGFLGSALVRELVAVGHGVRVFDNESRGNARRLRDIRNDLDVVEGDIRDLAAVRRVAGGMDGIIHLAFVNGTKYFYSRPQLVLDVGVRGILNVIDACLFEEIGELVIASSSEVYQSAPKVPTSEDVPLVVPDVLNPRFSYAAGKIITESLAINYGRSELRRVLVFRPHNVYGPDMGWDHVIPELILQIQKTVEGSSDSTIPVVMHGGGDQSRSFVYIDDCVKAVMRIIEVGQHLSIFHVGTSEEIAIRDLAAKIAARFGRQIRAVAGPLPVGETLRRCPDISKLRSIGFEPSVPLDAGLAITMDWYVENARLHPANQAYG